MLLSDNKIPSLPRLAYVYFRLVALYITIEAAEEWCLRQFNNGVNPIPHLRRGLTKSNNPVVESIHFNVIPREGKAPDYKLPKLFVLYSKECQTVKFHLV